MAVLQGESVDLGLDVGLLGSIVLQPLDVNLTVEVTDVADNSVVLHPVKRQSSMNLANGHN